MLFLLEASLGEWCYVGGVDSNRLERMLRMKDKLEEVILKAVNLGNDKDTITAVVGGLTMVLKVFQMSDR